MIPNYFDERIKQIMGKCTQLTIYDNPTKFISFYYENFPPVTDLELDLDSINNHVAPIMAALKVVKRTYSKTQVFTHPILSYNPTKGIWSIKIGLMEKTRWKEILKKGRQDAKHKDKN